MKRLLYICIFFLFCCYTDAQTKDIKLKLVETSDIHGDFYSYDFEDMVERTGGLEGVYGYLKEQRKTYGKNLLYFDNGDILQGQPTSYYYNFVDTVSTHLAASILNFMGCNAASFGNHDVETGHKVYDRWKKDCNFPLLGANIIELKTGKPYLKPYTIIERKGVKIAVFGMITPAIPMWLSEELFSGLYFEDMLTCAKTWIPYIREKEKPDLIVGLFHAGVKSTLLANKYNEDFSQVVAQQVPGFDIVMTGHDHVKALYKVKNVEGDSVLILNPASRGSYAAVADVVLTKAENGSWNKKINGSLVKMKGYAENGPEFRNHFQKQFQAVYDFSTKKIGRITCPFSDVDSYLGPSALIDFIHQIQLDVTKADISFTAPLTLNSDIPEGDLYVSDMFKLYKYENGLYIMRLKGREVKGALEMSYALWTNQMKSPDDHILLIDRRNSDNQHFFFKNFSFNFDSAAGIIYTVDVTKPAGEKITILSLADGKPFDLDKDYKVAINSYRGNGGGELLTVGAGIPLRELRHRIISIEEHDLRYYMINYITEKGTINPQPLNQWKFVPESWAVPAIARDRSLLFNR